MLSTQKPIFHTPILNLKKALVFKSTKKSPISTSNISQSLKLTNTHFNSPSKSYIRPIFSLQSPKNNKKSPISPNFPAKTMGKIGILDLEKHFAFYGAYHRNPTNIFIHMLFVWPILFTSVVILYFTPALVDCPFKCNIGLVPNIGLVFSVIYGVFYVCLDKKAGTLAAFLVFACWVFGSLLAKQLGYSLAWKVVLAAQLFCWTGQFIGHGVFEKRAPALLDNLTQAFLMAPFFVLLEALQSFGYEPYEGFHASVKAKIDSEVKKFQDEKAKKIS